MGNNIGVSFTVVMVVMMVFKVLVVVALPEAAVATAEYIK